MRMFPMEKVEMRKFLLGVSILACFFGFRMFRIRKDIFEGLIDELRDAESKDRFERRVKHIKNMKHFGNLPKDIEEMRNKFKVR